MSDILKIKSGDTWIGIPAIKGDKGDPGDVESVAGKTGAVTLDADDVAYDPADTYSSGTVGKELGNLQSNILDIFPTGSASGSVASFPDGAAGIPLKSLVVAINPVQSGSGDPSPSNVRPITGCTQIRMPHTGVNICGGNTMLSAIELTNPDSRAGSDSDGRYYSLYSGNSATNKTYIPRMFFKPNTKYTFILTLKMSGASGTNFNFRIYYTDGTNAGAVTSAAVANTKQTMVFTTAANKTVSAVVGYYSNNNTNYLYVDESGIFEGGLTAANFVAPVGNMEVIDIPDPPGTVYGGTLNVLTGELTVDRMSYTFTGSPDESWSSSNGCFVTYFLGTAIKRSSSTSGTADIVMCDSYKNGGVKYRDDVVNKTIVKTVGDNNQIALKDTDYESTALFTAHLQESPIQVVYRLATPVVYQLTPRQINTVLGLNNILTNYGSIFMEYRVDLQTELEITDYRAIGAYPIDSASGTFVSFGDGADKFPYKSCVVNFLPTQSGSGDPSPSNPRPITGTSSIKVNWSAYNMVDQDYLLNASGWAKSTDQGLTTYGVHNAQVYKGSIRALYNAFGTKATSVPIADAKPGHSYIVGYRWRSVSATSSNGLKMAVVYSDGTESALSGTQSANQTWTGRYIQTPTDKTPVGIRLDYSSDFQIYLTSLMCIESTLYFSQPDTPEDRSFANDLTSVAFTIPDPPGTVYTGTLDLVSGKLTIQNKGVYLGDYTWEYVNSSGGYFRTARLPDAQSLVENQYPDALCETYPTKTSSNMVNFDYAFAFGYGTSTYMYIVDHRYTSGEDLKASLQAANVLLVYKLKTPVEYQLTPVDMKTFRGQNLVWSNLDVSIDTEFRADVALFVDKKVSAAQALMELIITANRESSMKASTAYSAGALIIVNGTLYKATTSIASGATLTVGTNVTATTIAAELAAIS